MFRLLFQVYKYRKKSQNIFFLIISGPGKSIL